MKVGVHLPQWGPSASRAGVLQVAQFAEEAQFDSVWVADHIVFPTVSTSSYPYRSAGVPFAPEDGFLEALTTLGVVAGATERIGLGTSVLVLPMREPLLVAKSVATLDVLAGGRAAIAVGSGWWREEFDAVGATFDGRGPRFDDQLRILRQAWTNGVVQSDQGHYRFVEATCLPLPLQAGGPPLWVGGTGHTAWRRAAMLGDGWHAVGSDPAVILEGRHEIDDIAQEMGRDPASISLSTSTGFGRSAAHAVDRLSALRDVGLDQVVLNLGGPDASSAEVCKAIEHFAIQVRPSLGTDTTRSALA